MQKMKEVISERDLDLALLNRTEDIAGNPVAPFYTNCPKCGGRAEIFLDLKDSTKYKCPRCSHRFNVPRGPGYE